MTIAGCRTTRTVLLFAMALLAPVAPLRAAAPADADSLYAAQNWPGAAAAYEKLTAQDPNAATAWYRLGVARQHMKQHEQAVAAYRKAVALQPAMRGLQYNLACAHAVLGRTGEALATLGAAIENDFITPDRLRGDEDLASLRGRKEFDDLVEKADRKVRPCEHDPIAKQFDFWVGEWEVFTPQGGRAGHNRITRTDNGCLLLEEWTGGLGGTGKSINFYDTKSGKWNQIWVDSTGGILRYEGEYGDGAMVMIGRPAGRNNGPVVRTSWSLLPDGRVRHASEITQDDGKTWEPQFELLYTRSQ